MTSLKIIYVHQVCSDYPLDRMA